MLFDIIWFCWLYVSEVPNDQDLTFFVKLDMTFTIICLQLAYISLSFLISVHGSTIFPVAQTENIIELEIASIQFHESIMFYQENILLV